MRLESLARTERVNPGVRGNRVRIGVIVAVAACVLSRGLAWAQQPTPPAPPDPVATVQQAAVPPEPATGPPSWSGSAAAGLSLTSGNSETLNYNLGFDLTHTRLRNTLKFSGLHLRGKENDTLILNRRSLGVRHQYAWSPRAFVFSQVDYLHDTFKAIDYLIAPTGGVGYKLVDAKPTLFVVDAGAGAVWEKNPGGDVMASGALIAGEQLTYQLSATATLKHAATSLWKTNHFADSLTTVSVGLATKVSDRFQLSIDVLDTFKNRPPGPTTKKNDVAVVVALAAKF